MFFGESLRRLAGKLVLRKGLQRLHQLRARLGDVREVQRQLLREKLAQHADSRLGRDFGFPSIRSLPDFRRHVPITTYEHYAPYIEALQRGEQRAMLGPRERLLAFALTSGTSSQPKFIPVTQRSLREYQFGWTIWGTQAVWDHRDCIENPPHWRPKRILQLASTWDEFRTPGGTPCGSISGLMAQTQRRVVRSLYCLPPSVMDIHDPTAKYYTALRLAIPEVVGQVIAANPSTLVTLAKLGDQWKDRLIRDIAQGTLDEGFAVPGDVRQAIRLRIARPNRQRAWELERIVADTGHLYPRDYWPGLRLIGTWTGGTVGCYVAELPQYYGDVPVRDIGLLASEGRMTIPLEDGTAAGVLDFGNSFFEFVPREEMTSAQPTVLEAHELLEGREYYILLTTSGGLFRYHIHDLVRCVDRWGQAPRLEFLNKGSQFSSVTGEKLSEYQVVTAVQRSARGLGLNLSSFVLTPFWADPPYYVLLVEKGDVPMTNTPDVLLSKAWWRVDPGHQIPPGPSGHPSMSAVADPSRPTATGDADVAARHLARSLSLSVLRLAGEVDRHLGRLNREYLSKRESGRLGTVEVRLVPDGTWQRFDEHQRRRRGSTLEQYKHPFLIADLSFLLSLTDESGVGASLPR